jgi:hypothetical protein
MGNGSSNGRYSCITAAQQSVQWMVGILRGLQAFFWLWVFSALRHYPSPPHHH